MEPGWDFIISNVRALFQEEAKQKELEEIRREMEEEVETFEKKKKKEFEKLKEVYSENHLHIFITYSTNETTSCQITSNIHT